MRLSDGRLTCSAALVAALLMLTSDFEALINYFLVASWLFYFTAASCVPYLRWKEPELARPFR